MLNMTCRSNEARGQEIRVKLEACFRTWDIKVRSCHRDVWMAGCKQTKATPRSGLAALLETIRGAHQTMSWTTLQVIPKVIPSFPKVMPSLRFAFFMNGPPFDALGIRSWLKKQFLIDDTVWAHS